MGDFAFESILRVIVHECRWTNTTTTNYTVVYRLHEHIVDYQFKPDFAGHHFLPGNGPIFGLAADIQ